MSSRIKYGSWSKDKTNNTVGPDPDVLIIPEALKNYMFPIVLIDLEECTNHLRGKIPFIYAEYSESDRNNKALGLHYHIENNQLRLTDESIREFVRFIDEVQLPESPTPPAWKGKHLKFNDFTLYNNEDDPREEICDCIKNIGYNFPIFTHTPYWTQGSATPVNANDEPMEFIGQVNASYFTNYAGGYEIYLFYCPKTGLISQYAQYS